jgi:hypothetical protein
MEVRRGLAVGFVCVFITAVPNTQSCCVLCVYVCSTKSHGRSKKKSHFQNTHGNTAAA